MNSAYVCSRCRRSLSQFRTNQTYQRQTRANFISLSSRAPRSRAQDNSEDGSTRPEGRAGPSKSHRLGRMQEGPGITRAPGGRNPGDVLESLFEESLKPPTPSTSSPPQPFALLEPYKNIDTLRKMLSVGGNAGDSWFFFLEHFGPSAKNHTFDRRTSPSYLTTVARDLIQEVIREKKKNPLSQTLPSVTEVSRNYHQ